MLLGTGALQAQISPGALARAHQEIDGAANCTRCHAVRVNSADFRCLDCHKEIAVRLQQRRGYHAAVIPPNAPTNSCVRCHSDHNGLDFALIHWDPRTFDHSKTGYPLEGKHAGLQCAKCHNRDKVAQVERVTIQERDLNRTYLGLTRTCTSCHEDKHKGQLGPNCERCHNSTDWKAAKEFDHSKTKYQLTGAHSEVACAKCHLPQANGAIKYVGIKFDRCLDCHTDVHHGSFQGTCESCHSTLGWKRTPMLQTKFDHSKTKYPLTGKHMQVSCEACHHGADFKKEIAFKICADCHKPDPHSGQFAKRADGGLCESCHTVNGFKPATFGVPEHNRAPYPLRGKHAATPCAKCHIPAGKSTLYMVKFDTCVDCHKDVHKNQFAGAPHFNRCQDCHDENSFHRDAMTLAKHQEIDFKLTGGHLAVACIDCHKPMGEKGPVEYHFTNLSCTTCHADPHHGEFKARMVQVSSTTHSTGCSVCHSTETWNDLSRFDHGSTDYPLTGTHRAVGCAECHRPPNMERSMKNVDFKTAPTKCEECHENIHGIQFYRKGTQITPCADCHNTNKWRPSTFDHEKTIFSLKGPHEQTRCKACHINVVDVSGKNVLLYKPTPTACKSCHASNVIKTAAELKLPGQGAAHGF